MREHDGPAYHVLILDGSPEDRLFLARALQAALARTCLCLDASSTSEAIHQLNQDRIDCIFVHHHPPAVDGFELLRGLALRERADQPGVPSCVFVVSRPDEACVAVEALREGAIDFLVWEDLSPAALYRALRNAREHDQRVAMWQTMKAERNTMMAREQLARTMAERERKRLELLFEQTPALLVVLRGPELILQLATPAAFRLVGHRIQPGRTLGESLPELEAQGILKRIHQVMESGVPFSGHEQSMLIDRPGGEQREGFFNVTCQPTRGLDEEIDGLMIFGVDVTEEVQSRRLLEVSQEQLLARVVSAVPAFVCVVQAHTDLITLANPRLKEYFPQRPLEGRTLYDAFPELRGQGLFHLLHEVMHTGKMFEAHALPGHLDAVATEGSTDTYYNLILQPISSPDSEIEAVILYATDVTEHVLARRRAEALATDLQAAVSARDGFLSLASHELKTPLTTLMLQTQMFRRQLERDPAAAYSPERTSRLVQQMDRQIERLTRLINDMLDISRLASGRLTLQRERCGLVALIREVVERLSQLLTQAHCPVYIDAPVEIEGEWDRYRLEQVVTNLLINAARYGTGQPIEIFVARDNGTAVLRIRDHGRGIDRKDHERVFQRFERAIPATEVSGLGLGLYISRQLVEMHQGWIELESAPGEGATFSVHLPLEPVSAALPRPKEQTG